MGWDFECLDWEAKLRAGQPPIPELPLNLAAADKAVGIYNRLRLHDVAGTPTRGEAGGEWFRQTVVRPLFGSQFGTLKEGNCFREIRESSCLPSASQIGIRTAAGQRSGETTPRRLRRALAFPLRHATAIGYKYQRPYPRQQG